MITTQPSAKKPLLTPSNRAVISNGPKGLQFSLSQQDSLHDSASWSCFPLEPKTSSDTIPFTDILYCEQGEAPDEVEVVYAMTRDEEVVPKTVSLTVDDRRALEAARGVSSGDPPGTEGLAAQILSHAYESPETRSRRVLLLVNPVGGKGQAVRRLNTLIKPILDAAHVRYETIETKYHQHAIDIIKDLDMSQYDVIACCSGDGLPHEVINGIYLRPDREQVFQRVAVTQLPCGSGNALSLTCHGTAQPSVAAVSMIKSPGLRIDLMCVQQGSQRKLSFLSQTYGAIADADISTEWMRPIGPIRFDIGVAMKVFAGTKYPCDLYVKFKAKNAKEVAQHYQDHVTSDDTSASGADGADGDFAASDSAAGGPAAAFESQLPSIDAPVPSSWTKIPNTDSLMVFYTGKMPYIAKDTHFFPAALPDDGTMDLVVMNVESSLFSKAQMLLSLETGEHVFHKEMHYSKILAYRLVPRKKSFISVDGENFPTETMQTEVIPRGMLTISGGWKEWRV